MYWLRWHYHVKDIAGAPYKIKKKRKTTRQNRRQWGLGYIGQLKEGAGMARVSFIAHENIQAEDFFKLFTHLENFTDSNNATYMSDYY